MQAPLAKASQLALGFLTAVVVIGVVAEVFLRHFAPPELDLYLGERSRSRGPFVADPDFALRYRSWSDFRAESAADLTAWLEDDARPTARPVWLLVGNSFVHGAGMLVDHLRAAVPKRDIRTLHRTDPLPVRCAQLALLCTREPPPERIFIPLTTVDLLGLGTQPLSTLHVTGAGALTYAPRLPPEPGAWLMRHSNLAAAAWLQTGRHRGNPTFDKHRLDVAIDGPLRSDLLTLFRNLAHATHGTPITVVLIPSYQQLMSDFPDGFQRDLRALLEPLGYDAVDPLPALRRVPDRSALFLPDKHFTPLANRIVVTQLLDHLRVEGTTRTLR